MHTQISPYIKELVELADMYNDVEDTTDVFLSLSESDYEETADFSKKYFSPGNDAILEINKNNPFIIREINAYRQNDSTICKVVVFMDFKNSQMIMCLKEGYTNIVAITEQARSHVRDWYGFVQNGDESPALF